MNVCKHIFFAILCGFVAATQTLRASEPSHGPVVVELFTSEGCSSCPPADRVLLDLQKRSRPDAEIIVLSEHVDYWNYIGWKDPFSSKQFSDRQSAYAAAFQTDEVYTPQMVVDGAVGFIGSDRTRAMGEIEKAFGAPKTPLHVTAKEVPGAVVEVRVNGLKLNSGDAVFFALTEDALETLVKRGENAGKALSHTGVVRSISQIKPQAAMDSVSAKFDLRSDFRRSNLRAVVFVQDASRRITAAASVKPEFLLN